MFVQLNLLEALRALPSQNGTHGGSGDALNEDQWNRARETAESEADFTAPADALALVAAGEEEVAAETKPVIGERQVPKEAGDEPRPLPGEISAAGRAGSAVDRAVADRILRDVLDTGRVLAGRKFADTVTKGSNERTANAETPADGFRNRIAPNAGKDDGTAALPELPDEPEPAARNHRSVRIVPEGETPKRPAADRLATEIRPTRPTTEGLKTHDLMRELTDLARGDRHSGAVRDARPALEAHGRMRPGPRPESVEVSVGSRRPEVARKPEGPENARSVIDRRAGTDRLRPILRGEPVATGRATDARPAKLETESIIPARGTDLKPLLESDENVAARVGERVRIVPEREPVRNGATTGAKIAKTAEGEPGTERPNTNSDRSNDVKPDPARTRDEQSVRLDARADLRPDADVAPPRRYERGYAIRDLMDAEPRASRSEVVDDPEPVGKERAGEPRLDKTELETRTARTTVEPDRQVRQPLATPRSKIAQDSPLTPVRVETSKHVDRPLDGRPEASIVVENETAQRDAPRAASSEVPRWSNTKDGAPEGTRLDRMSEPSLRDLRDTGQQPNPAVAEEEAAARPQPATTPPSTATEADTIAKAQALAGATRQTTAGTGSEPTQTGTDSFASSPTTVQGDAATGETSTVRIHHRSLAEAIVARARALPQNGAVELRFALEPQDLGPVRVQIESRGEHLTIRIMASSEAAADMLSSGLTRLSAQLSESGLEAPNIDLGVDDSLNPGTQHRQGRSNLHGQQPRRPLADAPADQHTQSASYSGSSGSRLDMTA